jgi:SpoVK/Ycf46/Vps4 family AAA+-type ATPase
MASATLLAKLFKTIADRNLSEAEKVALEIAAKEEERGHHSAAQALRGALRPNGLRNGLQPIIPQQANSLALSKVLTPLASDVLFSDIMLRPKQRADLESLVIEWKNRDKLRSLGIPRRSRLLFHGPPGCGKSLSARALGRATGLPVFVVRFDALIGSFLGQTAMQISELFRYVQTTPVVLLIDEIDALAKRRGSLLDVGELDRVVITMLQELEHSLPEGFIVATSNLAKQLDEALWRRFDLVMQFPKPTPKEVTTYVAKRLTERNLTSSKSLLRLVSSLQSFAEADKVVQSEARTKALTAVRKNDR